jgi:hypothetical protein
MINNRGPTLPGLFDRTRSAGLNRCNGTCRDSCLRHEGILIEDLDNALIDALCVEFGLIQWETDGARRQRSA